jgi:hypothetical protein
VLHEETLEPALIQVPVAHRPMRHPPAHRMRMRESSEKGGQLPILLRPDHEMPMAWHHAIRKNANRVQGMGLNQYAIEGVKIGVLAEHFHSADGAVEHVIDLPGRRDARGSWHGGESVQLFRTNAILAAPPFLSLAAPPFLSPQFFFGQAAGKHAAMMDARVGRTGVCAMGTCPPEPMTLRFEIWGLLRLVRAWHPARAMLQLSRRPYVQCAN